MREVICLPWEQGLLCQAGPGDVRSTCPESAAWDAAAATRAPDDADGTGREILAASSAVRVPAYQGLGTIAEGSLACR